MASLSISKDNDVGYLSMAKKEREWCYSTNPFLQ